MTAPLGSLPSELSGDDVAPPPRESLRATLARHHKLIIAVVLIGLFIGIRLLYLTADAPLGLPNGVRVHELFTDPPAKSFEARNRALFGVWRTSESDNYQFWRLQAPVWVYPLSWFYRAFGVGYAQMRIFSTLCAASGLAVFLAFAAKRLRGFPYLLAGSFLTFNFYYIIFGRSGLLEALLNTPVILTVLFLYLAQKRLEWLMAAQLAVVAAFLTKQSGLFILPLAIVAGIIAYRKHLKTDIPGWLRVAPLVQAAGIAAFMGWYVLRDAYWRTVSWNYSHVLFNKDGGKQVDVGRFPLLKALDRLRTFETWDEGFFSLFPIAGTLAILGLARILYLAIRRKRRDAWELLVAGWAVSAFGVLLLTPFLWVHYRLILFPPVALLAASFVNAGFRHKWTARKPWVKASLGLAILGLDLPQHLSWYYDWVSVRSYAVIETRDAIVEHIGDKPAVFGGMWAGPLIFDTNYKYYYIKTIFNTDRKVLGELGLTHMIELDRFDLASQRLWRVYPQAMRDRELIFAFDMRQHGVAFYSFAEPPGNEPEPAPRKKKDASPSADASGEPAAEPPSNKPERPDTDEHGPDPE